jgi:hypothetical protein
MPARNLFCMIAMPGVLNLFPEPPSSVACEAEPEDKRNSECEKYDGIHSNQKLTPFLDSEESGR